MMVLKGPVVKSFDGVYVANEEGKEDEVPGENKES